MFALELTGLTMGYFTGCSGLSASYDVVEKNTTDAKGNLAITKIPGRLKFEDIVLKRGMTSDKSLQKWFTEFDGGKGERKDGSIVLYDRAGTEVARWDFKAGWPSKWSGGDLSSDSDDWMVEELTISHELLERK
ncbi:MAG: phage tail protein [Acidimicrobiales bacterium]